MVALKHGGGLLTGGVGTCAGFGKAERAYLLAAEQGGQILHLLLLGAVLEYGGAAQRGMRGNYNAGCGAAFAQFLNSHCVSQNVSAGSAVLGGERNAHETVTSKLLNGFHREAFFLVYLFRKGLHFVFSELAVQIPKHQMLL